ncbi:energy transducer TonB [Flavobacterium psychrophilum]|uniref:energy transducer TonB n=1 Tax=Flavobacterium psychrophilum TaxID=96345 RepID=UPI00106AF9B7|nr:hypothetical protein [Flavobacterium psychrophilum]
MKNILTLCLLITFLSCKKENSSKIEQKTNEIEIKKSELNDFSKTDFKDRAEELVYIREYLNYKLPIILVDKKPDQMKKVQYELISRGENPSIEEAAKRSLHFSNLFEPYMSLIISENTTFKIVKQQLETKGKLDFEISKKENQIISEIKEINSEEKDDSEKPIKKNTENALDNLLKNKNSETEQNQSGNGVGNGGNGVGYGKSLSEPYFLTGRKVINKTIPEYNCSEFGRVVIEITVDRNGNVLDANLGRGSTTNEKCLVNASKIAAMNTIWNIDENASEKQKGKIIYDFKM